MRVTPGEFYAVLTGEADDEVRQRVLKAIHEGDPLVHGLIELRRQRALEWLERLADDTEGIVQVPMPEESNLETPDPTGEQSDT